VRGGAVLLTGKDSYLDYGAGPAYNFAAGAPFTFAGWLRTARAGATVLSQRNSRAPAPVIDITVEEGRLCGLVRQDGFEGGQAARVCSAGKVSDGAWHHFALTRDNTGQVELFVDGVSQGKATGAASGGAVTTDWRTVGLERYWAKGGAAFGTPDFDGAVDELCVYDRALRPEEVQALAGR
jgi:sialidase-1